VLLEPESQADCRHRAASAAMIPHPPREEKGTANCVTPICRAYAALCVFWSWPRTFHPRPEDRPRGSPTDPCPGGRSLHACSHDRVRGAPCQLRNSYDEKKLEGPDSRQRSCRR
jgi:hypothetical protein